MKFLLPEGLDRTYYVTEKFLEVNHIYQVVVNLLTTFILQTEECSNTADMIQQAGDMRSLLESSLNKLSHIQDRMKMVEGPCYQMCPGTLDESGYVDCYQTDFAYEESHCEERSSLVRGPHHNRRGQFNRSVAEFEKENSRNHSLLPVRNRRARKD